MIDVQMLPAETWQHFTEHRLNIASGSAEQYKHPCLVTDPQFERIFLKQCGMDSRS